MPEAIPILVVGRNRSGTKWLSNLLCNNSLVTGVQSESHYGIVETNLFGRMQRLVGDIGDSSTYASFVELWSQTDFFHASGVSKQWLLETTPRPANVLATFERVMRERARAHGARFWLQKTSPVEALAVLPELHGCRVVTIERDLPSALASSILPRRARGEDPSLVRAAFGYALQAKALARIRTRYPGAAVRYEVLRDDPEAELRRLCPALGLDYEPRMTTVRYRRNTSFGDAPPQEFEPGERRLARVAYGLARLVPIALLLALRGLAGPSAGDVLVDGTFRDLERRDGPR